MSDDLMTATRRTAGPPGRGGRPGPVVAVAAAVTAGVLLGALTASAQGWLPPQVASLANSACPWALAAFGVAMIAPSARWAACCGAAVLASLLVGYVALNALRGLPSSTGLVVVWGAAAVLVGPVLGLGGYWLRRRRDVLAALGAGGMSGVLVGEGAYGLRFIAETTHPPYWWGSIVAGALLLAVAAGARLRRPLLTGLAVLVAAAVSVAFVLAYSSTSTDLGAV